ncbi:hypothetical protein OJ998_08835 [Solirubrobacter taibaiensis]|nr:hypothetical protein [Solirubrobacter taibaiensis]
MPRVANPQSVAGWVRRAALTDPRGDNLLAAALGVSSEQVRAVREQAAREGREHVTHRGYGGTPPRTRPPAP